MLGGIVPCPGGWLILPGASRRRDGHRRGAARSSSRCSTCSSTSRSSMPRRSMRRSGFYDYPVGPYRPCDARRGDGRLAARGRRCKPDAVACRPARRDREEARQIEPWLTNDDFRRFKWWRQAEHESSRSTSAMFFAAHPDLSFTSLNGDVPVEDLAASPRGRCSSGCSLIREQDCPASRTSSCACRRPVPDSCT